MGIDQSMNSSGKVVMTLDDATMDILDVQFYGYHKTKKRCINTESVHVKCMGNNWGTRSVVERRMIAVDYLMEGVDDVQYMAVEDYAYHKLKRKECDTNSILQLAELCGTLKTEAYRRGIGVISYPIMQNKQFATGNGNAGKPEMCCALKQIYPEWFPPEFEGNFDSPVNDMADGFWLCEVLRNHIMYDRNLPLDDSIKALLESKSGYENKCILETPLFMRTDV